MDAETRARYEAWMWKKIFRRLIVPGALLLVVLIALISGLRSCGSSSNDGEESEGRSYSSETESSSELDAPTDQSVASRQPTYQDFDFSIYDEDAIVEIEASWLNSYAVLVNKVFRLPEDFSPVDLDVPQVLAVWSHPNEVLRMRETAARALEEMFEEALEDEGLELWVVSGYRSFEGQGTKHQGFIDTYGREEAENMSARPGHSEHQTGLAIDISSASVGALLTEDFGAVPEGIWLRENAHYFGFIVRYPAGRQSLTGVNYEPWHLRYVGVEAATYIFENDIVLEQYIFPIPRWDQP